MPVFKCVHFEAPMAHSCTGQTTFPLEKIPMALNKTDFTSSSCQKITAGDRSSSGNFFVAFYYLKYHINVVFYFVAPALRLPNEN